MLTSYFTRDLFSELDRLQQAMHQTLDSSARSIRGLAEFPAINIGTTPSSIEVYAFAPGLDPAKVDVQIDRGVLTIAGERAPSAKGQDGAATPHTSERFVGRFRRVVSLPDDVDPASVEANYRDGVLRIDIQRKDAPQPRRITVQ